MRTLTDAERSLLTHLSMFGSDGYPIRRLGRGWTWGTDAVPGPPTTYPTKREAVASFEAFVDVLLDAHAAEGCRAAWAARGLEGEALERAVEAAGAYRSGILTMDELDEALDAIESGQ